MILYYNYLQSDFKFSVIFIILAFIYQFPGIYILTVIFTIIVLIVLQVNQKRFYALTSPKQTEANFKWLKSHYPGIDIMISAAAGFIFITLCSIAIYKADYVRDYNPYKGSEIILKNKELIKATNKVLLIGKSQNFYFFYNTPDSSIRIINRADIRKEVLKKRSDINIFIDF